MKKLILSVTALAAGSVGAFAQGQMFFDTHSSGVPVTINGATATQDINAELLYSTTGAAGTFNPVVTLLLSSSNTAGDGLPGYDPSDILTAAGDITFLHTGGLQDQSGNPYTLSGPAVGASVFFEVEGWTGNNVNSMPAAGTPGTYGTSAVFSGVLGGPPSVPPPSLGGFTGLALTTVAVPEPSTLAMAGVGLASMLMFRRRNK